MGCCAMSGWAKCCGGRHAGATHIGVCVRACCYGVRPVRQLARLRWLLAWAAPNQQANQQPPCAHFKSSIWHTGIITQKGPRQTPTELRAASGLSVLMVGGRRWGVEGGEACRDLVPLVPPPHQQAPAAQVRSPWEASRGQRRTKPRHETAHPPLPPWSALFLHRRKENRRRCMGVGRGRQQAFYEQAWSAHCGTTYAH